MSNNSGVDLERLRKLIDTTTREKIAAAFNCDQSLITKHYNGQRAVTTDYLKKYASYFNVSADYLLNLSAAATSDKDIQYICDYTHLSEKAIEQLHSLNSKQVLDYYTAITPDQAIYESENVIPKKMFEIINYVLENQAFYDLICNMYYSEMYFNFLIDFYTNTEIEKIDKNDEELIKMEFYETTAFRNILEYKSSVLKVQTLVDQLFGNEKPHLMAIDDIAKRFFDECFESLYEKWEPNISKEKREEIETKIKTEIMQAYN